MKKLLLILVAFVCCLSLFTQDALLIYRQNYAKPLFVALKDVTTISHSDSAQVLSLEEWNIQAQSLASDIDSIVFIESDTINSSDYAYFSCPDDHHPHMIDLGLPSGTLWSCCNVGATNPEEYGGYYAWGETEEKDYYDWSTYVHCDGTRSTLHNIGDDIAGTEYDVAHVKWGESWHLPSVDQIQELLDNCTSSWSALNGVEGLRFTGINGSVIFLPAASEYFLGKVVNEYPNGNYWSSSFNEGRGDKYHSYTLEFDFYECRVRESERRDGLSVRAVYSELPEPDFIICPKSVVLTIGNSITINITTGSGNYEITNSNTDVVEAALYGTSIALTAKEAGSAVITVKDISSNKTADISVSIRSPRSYVPAEAIDLGLPSGTLWASWNIGATAPEEYGEYFAWGETEEKDYYDWSTYIHCDGTAETCHNIGNNIAGTDYDPAQIKWGDPWRMPSRDQFAELIENCTRTWTSQNDTNGILFTGSNGNTIFIPAAGNRLEDYININGTHCIYWVSSVYRGSEGWAWNAIMNSEVQYLTDGDRYHGEPIRPICLTKPIPDLSISQDSVELNVGDTAFIEITSGSGNYEVSNSNTSIVEATLDGTTITFCGLSEGNAVVTVKDISTGQTARIDVTVTSPAGHCPDDNHPHLIDLGLPSGTKWACCNVDATKPEEYGGYYAWGETEEKDYYAWSTYIHCDGTGSSCHHIGDDIAGTEYDVAHVKWGGPWKMPSYDQMDELFNNSTLTWTSQDGINGYLVTGPNGSSIFLPASDYIMKDNKNVGGTGGWYWSSCLYQHEERRASLLSFGSSGWYWDNEGHRYIGNSVRPIVNQNDYCPEPEAIDLGLPSGTKWASWNVGASAPEEYGGYYAWGETEEKDYYAWSTYIHCDGTRRSCHHIGDDIAGTEYDVAHMKWGGTWRMPSIDQFKELIDKCTRIWTSQNGVNGILVTGPNGNTIFLPAAGDHAGDNLSWVGKYGCYWSSSNYRIEDGYAYSQCFDSNNWFMDSSWFQRYFGQSVRAVISP